MDIDDQDQVAVATSQVRALLNLVSAAGHHAAREDLLEVVGVAAEKADLACRLVSQDGPEMEGPGKSPARVVIKSCGSGVVCQLHSIAAS